MSLEDAISENTKWLEKVHVELLVMNNMAKDGALKPGAYKVSETIDMTKSGQVDDTKKEIKTAKAEKAVKEEKKVEPPKEEAKGASLADAQKAITQLCAKMGSDEGRAILKEFGVERVSGLDPKNFGKFIERCENSLAML